jgi:hypothetical protein
MITGRRAAAETEEALVSEAIDQESFTPPGALMLFYRAALPLSSRTLTVVSGVIRRSASRSGRAGGS